MDQPELLTDRLKLRPFEVEDSPSVELLAGNVKVARMTLNVPHPYLPGMAKDWIVTHVDGWNSRAHISYAITSIDSGALLGAMGLSKSDEFTADLGYWFGEPYWGEGYCTEAATSLLAFSFNELNYQSITAKHLANNVASGRVMIKAGMKYLKDSDGFDRNQEPVQFKHYRIESVDAKGTSY